MKFKEDFFMILLSADTEMTITDMMQQGAEVAKNADPGMIESYLKGLVPDLFNFGMQVLIALLVYFVGMKVIKFLRRRIKNWFTK